MPRLENPIALFTQRAYLELETRRTWYERLALEAYEAAGSPYSAQLGPLPGALLWLQEEAAQQGLEWAEWLTVWHLFLGRLRSEGVVRDPREAPHDR